MGLLFRIQLVACLDTFDEVFDNYVLSSKRGTSLLAYLLTAMRFYVYILQVKTGVAKIA
jgi:hypothetical protein